MMGGTVGRLCGGSIEHHAVHPLNPPFSSVYA